MSTVEPDVNSGGVWHIPCPHQRVEVQGDGPFRAVCLDCSEKGPARTSPARARNALRRRPRRYAQLRFRL